MELEKQCASLEPSKKLSELGVPQNSFFYWVVFVDGQAPFIVFIKGQAEDYQRQGAEIFSAFTVAELGEILPHKIQNKYLTIVKHKEYGEKATWGVCYKEANHNFLTGTLYSNKLTDALSQILTYLLENGLIRAEELA